MSVLSDLSTPPLQRRMSTCPTCIEHGVVNPDLAPFLLVGGHDRESFQLLESADQRCDAHRPAWKAEEVSWEQLYAGLQM